jgi:hypothetical protein
LSLDLIGRGFGTASPAPESLLHRYDLVFAKGRSALEAMAVGTAVVPVSAFGLGPMVTAADFDRLRRLNFGIRALRLPLTPAALIAEIARYDAADAAEVSRRVRATADREDAVDALVALYRGVLDRWRDPLSHPGAPEESRAASRYLRSLTSTLKQAAAERAALTGRAEAAEALPAQLRERIAVLEAQVDHGRATIGHMERSRFWQARRMWGAVRGWRPGRR